MLASLGRAVTPALCAIAGSTFFLSIILGLGGAVQSALGAVSRGTQTISGSVTSDDGRPVAFAAVRLVDVDTSKTFFAETDADGHFSFVGPHAALYSLVASKSGFVAATYGEFRVRGAGTPIVLSVGEVLDGLTIRVRREAVIFGTVRRPDGVPLGAVVVRVLEPTIVSSGRRELLAVRTGVTDDRGAYEIAGIPPGQYFVKAVPAVGIPISLSEITARPTDAGAHVLPVVSQSHARLQGYAASYYPGSIHASGAEMISVLAGERRRGIDIGLTVVYGASVEGRIVGHGSPPVLRSGEVVLAPSDPYQDPIAVKRAKVSFDTFAIYDVFPGDYVLRASTRSSLVDGPELRASARIIVTAGADHKGINLVLLPASSLRGTLTFDGSAKMPPEASFSISLDPVTIEGGDGAVGLPVRGDVLPDGSFHFTSVWPGRYRIVFMLTSGSEGWVTKSVTVEGREVENCLLDIGPGEHRSDVLLNLTARMGRVVGTLRDSMDQPATKYTVILFPSNRASWSPLSRRTVAVRPTNTGAFSVDRVPFGDYLLAVVDDPASNEWLLPDFLETLVPMSTTLTVSNQATTEVRLKVK